MCFINNCLEIAVLVKKRPDVIIIDIVLSNETNYED